MNSNKITIQDSASWVKFRERKVKLRVTFFHQCDAVGEKLNILEKAYSAAKKQIIQQDIAINRLKQGAVPSHLNAQARDALLVALQGMTSKQAHDFSSYGARAPLLIPKAYVTPLKAPDTIKNLGSSRVTFRSLHQLAKPGGSHFSGCYSFKNRLLGLSYYSEVLRSTAHQSKELTRSELVTLCKVIHRGLDTYLCSPSLWKIHLSTGDNSGYRPFLNVDQVKEIFPEAHTEF